MPSTDNRLIEEPSHQVLEVELRESEQGDFRMGSCEYLLPVTG